MTTDTMPAIREIGIHQLTTRKFRSDGALAQQRTMHEEWTDVRRLAQGHETREEVGEDPRRFLGSSRSQKKRAS
jgi:hypothetical protein